MIVSLHEPRVIHLPNDTTLFPGANKVDAAKFMSIANHPTIQKMVADGILSYDEPAKGKETSEMLHLKALKTKEAQDLIEQTIDVSLLQGWLKSETRAPIKNSIEKQLKELNAPTIRRSGESESETSNPAHEDLKPDFSKD
jgi:hypothetical protein